MRAGLVVAAIALAGSAVAPLAHAGPSGDTALLCQQAKVTCSVQVPSTWTEGETHEVAVTGRARTTVELRAFSVEPGRIAGSATLSPLGKPVQISTDERGFGATDLTIGALADGVPGGPVLIAVADSRSGDLAEVLGTWTTVASRTPLVLGDGYGRRKPVGTDLRLVLDAVADETTFEVQLRHDGQWDPVGATSSDGCDGAQPCTVRYQVPRGLPPHGHEARLVNLTTGAAVAEWVVVPDPIGTRQPLRSPVFTEVGTAVAGAVTEGGGVSGNPVPRARSANLELPEGAEMAGPRERSGGGAPVEMVRNVALVFAVLAMLSALLLTRRRR